VDLATGQGEIPLTHPEVIVGVECTGATCSKEGPNVIVRAQAKLVSAVDLHFVLAPHAFYKKGEALEPEPTLRLAVLHCPMSVASGPPIRNVDNPRLIVKFTGRCAKDLGQMHFFVGPSAVEVLETKIDGESAWAVLRLDTLDSGTLSITAV